MKKKILLLLILVVAAVAFYSALRLTDTRNEADFLLVNGTVYTLEGKAGIAGAVAIHGDRIIATGTPGELTDRYPRAEQLDLHGATVVPGLIDGHAHVAGEGARLEGVNLVGTGSVRQIVDLVAGRVKTLSPGKWVIGRGWDQNDWDVKAFPTHNLLSSVSPVNPVVLRRVDGHAIWVNARAMELAGIDRATPDTAGGRIFRDASGNPTGIFVDNAEELVLRAIPEPADDDIERQLLLAMEECSKFGLTEVHDMGVDLQTIRVYKKLIAGNRCPVRIYAAIGGPGETWNHYLTTGPEIGFGGGMLTVRAIKLYIDGALGSRGAALIDAYSDDPGNRGLTIMSEQELESVCGMALRHGFQVCTHAIGDRGNLIVLNEYERALQQQSHGTPSPRWRIEHAQIVRPSDIPRFFKAGIIPSMQPTHATSDMYWAVDRLGNERIQGAYAWRSFLNTGCRIIGGSDSPIESSNPLLGIYAAITRTDATGYPPGGWMPQERMTREEALRCFSEWAAEGSFEEGQKGRIAPGMWADLTVLSRDIMKIEPKDILQTEVVMTIVGGRIVYRNDRFAGDRNAVVN
jgi:predicted amidohydrolase YtcJ